MRKSWIILAGLFAAAGAAAWIWGWGRFPTDAVRSRDPTDKSQSSLPALKLTGNRESTSLAVAPGPIHFTDMTRNSGVDFVHVSGDSAEKPFPAENGSGVGAFDFDLDGQVDLYFLTGTGFPVNRARPGPVNRCFRNLGDWHFQDVTRQTG